MTLAWGTKNSPAGETQGIEVQLVLSKSGTHSCSLRSERARHEEEAHETENGTNDPRDHFLCHAGCPGAGGTGARVLNVGCGRELRLHVERDDRHAAGWGVCHGGPRHLRPDG